MLLVSLSSLELLYGWFEEDVDAACTDPSCYLYLDLVAQSVFLFVYETIKVDVPSHNLWSDDTMHNLLKPTGT